MKDIKRPIMQYRFTLVHFIDFSMSLFIIPHLFIFIMTIVTLWRELSKKKKIKIIINKSST